MKILYINKFINKYLINKLISFIVFNSLLMVLTGCGTNTGKSVTLPGNENEVEVEYNQQDPIRTCGNKEYYITLINPEEFSEESILFIAEAAGFWNTAQSRSFISIDSEAVSKNAREIEIEFVDEPPCTDCKGQAVQLDETNTCWVRILGNSVSRVELMAHEFGHCLGLGHTDDHHSIMHPRALSKVIPDILIDQLTSLSECDEVGPNE